jgi:hypothetical protein
VEPDARVGLNGTRSENNPAKRPSSTFSDIDEA